MQSVFNNGYFGGAATPGYQYENPNTLQWTNPLKPEEERELHRGPQTLSLDIPKESMYRAKCTHRDPATHQFTVRPADDGNGFVCTKCGAKFNIVNGRSMKEINEIIGGAIDILQTTKMMYVDMTPEVIQSFFVILPFLELAPKMYEAAVNTFNKIMPNTTLGSNYQYGNAFNNYYGMVGNAGMNPMMGGMPMGTPGMMGGMPMPGMDPNVVPNPWAGMANPMQMGTVPDVNNPMMASGAAPMGAAPAMAPAQPAAPAPAAASAPAEGTPVTTSNKYSLA